MKNIFITSFFILSLFITAHSVAAEYEYGDTIFTSAVRLSIGNYHVGYDDEVDDARAFANGSSNTWNGVTYAATIASGDLNDSEDFVFFTVSTCKNEYKTSGIDWIFVSISGTYTDAKCTYRYPDKCEGLAGLPSEHPPYCYGGCAVTGAGELWTYTGSSCIDSDDSDSSSSSSSSSSSDSSSSQDTNSSDSSDGNGSSSSSDNSSASSSTDNGSNSSAGSNSSSSSSVDCDNADHNGCGVPYVDDDGCYHNTDGQKFCQSPPLPDDHIPANCFKDHLNDKIYCATPSSSSASSAGGASSESEGDDSSASSQNSSSASSECDPESGDCDGPSIKEGVCIEDGRTPPECTGNPIACSIAVTDWQNSCDAKLWRDDLKGSDEYNNGDSLLDNPGENDANEIGTDDINYSDKFDIDDSGFAAGSCPASQEIAVMGRTIEISWQPICDLAIKINPFLIAIAYFLAGVIFFKRVF